MRSEVDSVNTFDMMRVTLQEHGQLKLTLKEIIIVSFIKSKEIVDINTLFLEILKHASTLKIL